MGKLFSRSVLILIILVLVSSVFLKNSPKSNSVPEKVATSSSQQVKQKGDLVLVKRVVDGDTIELDSGQKVRYIGINTPETVDPRTTVQCFGREASAKNKELVEGKKVRLEKDVSETDQYGRLLRYVWVDSVFVNDYLVKEGFAYATAYPPDVKYQALFSSSQTSAQANKKGLWATCENGRVL